MFIGQIGIRIIVSRRCNKFPQFDDDGIDTFFRDLSATEAAPRTMPVVWAICYASVMRLLELISDTSNGWNSELAE